jgi:hypothetical protein
MTRKKIEAYISDNSSRYIEKNKHEYLSLGEMIDVLILRAESDERTWPHIPAHEQEKMKCK